MNNTEFFKQAKFGMFIHWGLYSLPAGEWKGKRTEFPGEWVMAYNKIPVKEYEQLAKAFNPIFFDAEEWVRLAKDAGMNYMVVTSKHHDGFCLFQSEVDSYNDHRIAMSAAIASLICENPVKIGRFEAINKSYPTFGENFC